MDVLYTHWVAEVWVYTGGPYEQSFERLHDYSPSAAQQTRGGGRLIAFKEWTIAAPFVMKLQWAVVCCSTAQHSGTVLHLQSPPW